MKPSVLTYLIPTHNRPEQLRATLHALARLNVLEHEAIGGAEVLVIDSASQPAVQLPRTLPNGWPLRTIRLNRNCAVAARNFGVRESGAGEESWIVMLDDDSYPLNSDHIDVLRTAETDIAAIGANIVLPDGTREAGGLPEVFIGCGAAIRRDAFLQVGGYDEAFDYYAEEYDLCAKLIRAGWRIVHDQRFRVRHEKHATGRDMNRILQRLVRNNGWVMQRYAPRSQRDAQLGEVITRYARIAMKERAAAGCACGVAELLRTLHRQPQREMSHVQFDRFTGVHHVRQYLRASGLITFGTRVAMLSRPPFVSTAAKHDWAVREALCELGATMVDDVISADVCVMGTLSPGPMLDALARCAHIAAPVLVPWQPRHAEISALAACV